MDAAVSVIVMIGMLAIVPTGLHLIDVPLALRRLWLAGAATGAAALWLPRGPTATALAIAYTASTIALAAYAPVRWATPHTRTPRPPTDRHRTNTAALADHIDHADHAAQATHADCGDQPDRADHPTRTHHAARVARADHASSADCATGADHGGCADLPVRVDHAPGTDCVAATDHGGYADRPARADHASRADRADRDGRGGRVDRVACGDRGRASPCSAGRGFGGVRGVACRLWRGREGGVAEFAVLVALVMPAVAGAALVAERAGWRLFGFSLEILALTVAHFHYAGFAAALIAGLVSRAAGGGWLSRVAALSVPAGTLAVLVGYFTGEWVEFAGAVVLTAGMWAVGLLTWWEARSRDRVTRVLLLVSAVVLAGTMVLALSWALGEASGIPHPSLDWMVATHGIGNALGFALCGMLAWARLRREAP
ncbi:YndJ family protein [Thermomonospora umbrina]|uniref:YndJ-like protein n=1 Tax=Thermomonospora umbrina TaxID=111806 RepID=A0A3D9T395_9ACTN|nr:YndJ family protein [Thermomonospora umbrina]REE99234.1 YndJ-like protein [Thermomonospora umbrina]